MEKKEKERSLLRDGVRLVSCPLRFKSTVHGPDRCFLDHCQPRSHAAGSLKTPELKENEIELTAGGESDFSGSEFGKVRTKLLRLDGFQRLYFFPPQGSGGS